MILQAHNDDQPGGPDRLSDDDYAEIAQLTAVSTEAVVKGVCEACYEPGAPVRDIGPILHGGVYALLKTCVGGGVPEPAIRRLIARAVDIELPELIRELAEA